MRTGIRMSKLEARQRGFDEGRKIAQRVDYSPILDVMAERCLNDRTGAVQRFTKQIIRVSAIRADVLSAAFYAGLVTGIAKTIRERRSNGQ